MKKTFRFTGFLRKRADEYNLILNGKKKKLSEEDRQMYQSFLLGVYCRGDSPESQAPNSAFPHYVFLRIIIYILASIPLP